MSKALRTAAIIVGAAGAIATGIGAVPGLAGAIGIGGSCSTRGRGHAVRPAADLL